MADAVRYEELLPYLDALVPPRHSELQAMEAHADATGFPIVGPASAQALYLLARLIGARHVYELGSGYGYSTAWFARAVEENGGGVVDHVVWDEGLSQQARGHLGRLGYPADDSGEPGTTRIRYTVGEAVAAFSSFEGQVDLVFNDIEKRAYPSTIEVVRARLRAGGLFITDNVLWAGRVLEGRGDGDAQTEAILEFNRRLTESADWDVTLLPIRDGLLVARRR